MTLESLFDFVLRSCWIYGVRSAACVDVGDREFILLLEESSGEQAMVVEQFITMQAKERCVHAFSRNALRWAFGDETVDQVLRTRMVGWEYAR